MNEPVASEGQRSVRQVLDAFAGASAAARARVMTDLSVGAFDAEEVARQIQLAGTESLLRRISRAETLTSLDERSAVGVRGGQFYVPGSKHDPETCSSCLQQRAR